MAEYAAQLMVMPEISAIDGAVLDRYSAISTCMNTASAASVTNLRSWMSQSAIHRERLDARWSGLRHRLSAKLAPHSSDSFDDGRSLIEWGYLDQFRSSFVEAIGVPGGFASLLGRIHSKIEPGRVGYRDCEVWTAEDTLGNYVRYPAHQSIVEQLSRLDDFVVRYHKKYCALTATVAMAAISNLHPFRDGNGRVSRIVFNAIVNRGVRNTVYLPIYELSSLSNCGFLLYLREAQYFNNWGGLADFFECSCRNLFDEVVDVRLPS